MEKVKRQARFNDIAKMDGVTDVRTRKKRL